MWLSFPLGVRGDVPACSGEPDDRVLPHLHYEWEEKRNRLMLQQQTSSSLYTFETVQGFCFPQRETVSGVWFFFMIGLHPSHPHYLWKFSFSEDATVSWIVAFISCLCRRRHLVSHTHFLLPAEELLNNFAQQNGAWRHCLFFLSNTRNEYVMMYSLTVFEVSCAYLWF